ncbi:ricin-type beta-trefoil lectin domain protein [Kitasatospora sp. NBC_01302]|uniref:ricin-type beta-trefoil lectin domain protein n=1 Tax=Kitasatospora sp. NBC_01302 TaxID=2903575 RepID=UPI002E12756E|nr:ricin-type beta-trefoil lectin domain protein [Kitasatospora sp. NBC_01302]
MRERIRAPRRRSGGILRHLAAISALATLAAGVVTPAFATPAFAGAREQTPAGASTAAAGTGVPGDLTGDGLPDLARVEPYQQVDYAYSGSGSALTVYPAHGAPYTASTPADGPAGGDWNGYLVTHHGSLTGSGSDDLYALHPYDTSLWMYPSDADFGGAPGYFTHPEKAQQVAKPACAAPTDCTAYSTSWQYVSQLVATDGIANSDGLPDLVTVENGKLWYYPGKAGSFLGSPILLGTGDWSNTTIAAPGKVGGSTVLWAQDNLTGAVRSYPLDPTAGATALLTPPAHGNIQTAVAQASGSRLCAGLGGYSSIATQNCGDANSAQWAFGTDGTVHGDGFCLSSGPADSTGRIPAQVVACDGGGAQKWTAGTGGTLVQNQSGRCLAVSGDATAVGSTLVLATCDGSSAQSWGVVSGSAFGPLPAAQPLLVPGLPSTSLGNTVGAGISLSADLDRSGNPALVSADLHVYPGSPASNGIARFGQPVPTSGRTQQAWPLLIENNNYSSLGTDGVVYSACAKLVMQADGNLVLYALKTGQALWASGTYGKVGPHPQADMSGWGNLEISDAASPGQPVWSPTTGYRPGAHAVVQDDCNFVVYDGNNQAVWSTQTYGASHTAPGRALPGGTVLNPGDSVTAARSRLTMQPDGNLVLTSLVTGNVLWASGTWPHSGSTATVQADGNVVVYDPNHNAIWSTGTWGHGGDQLVVQDDHGLALYGPDGRTLWSAGTQQVDPGQLGVVYTHGISSYSTAAWQLAPGTSLQPVKAHLTMQTDGNLVLYTQAGNNALWSSQTWGNPGGGVTLQRDGNLVVFDGNRRQLWSSGTAGHPYDYAVVQNDCNFVIYDGDGKPLWSTATWGRC